MNLYVLCYAHPKGYGCFEHVLLIEKKRPDWQAGRFNLPGGKIEDGETIHQAASRKLMEETDLNSPPEMIRLMGTIKGPDFVVYVCYCDYDPQDAFAVSVTDERVFWMPIKEALQSPRLLANLRLVIPFCCVGLTAWHITNEREDVYRISEDNAKTNIS